MTETPNDPNEVQPEDDEALTEYLRSVAIDAGEFNEEEEAGDGEV